jgi:hypothetical protein
LAGAADGGDRAHRGPDRAAADAKVATLAATPPTLGVGTSIGAPSWQPALAWRAVARGIRLQVRGGKEFDCRPVKN